MNIETAFIVLYILAGLGVFVWLAATAVHGAKRAEKFLNDLFGVI